MSVTLPRGLAVLAALSLPVLFGCNSGKVAETPPAAPPAPAVQPKVSINAVMVALVDHAGHKLWDAEKEGRAPKTDGDWQVIEHHAIQMAAAGPLIALGGTGQADPGWAQSPDWKKHSQELTNVGVTLISAAHNKDLPGLIKANGQLVEVCEACHKEFKPSLPTEGITHSHEE